jgi:hypothetical protein
MYLCERVGHGYVDIDWIIPGNGERRRKFTTCQRCGKTWQE